MLDKLGKLMTRFPVKTVMITLIISLVTISGALFVVLKTGNDTFINTDTDVYQNTEYYTENYGNTPIIVMYEPSGDEVLDIETIKDMKALEDSIKSHDDVFSILSPVTMLQNISETQRNTFMQSIQSMEEGLSDSSEGLSTFADQLENLSEVDKQALLDNLSSGFDDLSSAQGSLNEELLTMSDSLATFETNLRDTAETLEQKAEAENDSELQIMSASLINLADNLREVPGGLNTLAGIASNTQSGLSAMETTLQNELGLLFTKMEMLSEGSADLSAMASGFSDMSEGLGTIYERRDTLHAGLPSEQSTLKAMAYKDDGGLRTVFESMIVKDTYALFTVSMKGSDEEASKAVIDTLDAHIEDSDYSGERLLSGKSVLDVSIKDSMKGSLPELLALAVGVMIALLIVFFKVRWRILPLITTMLAVVVTIGLMGYLSVPITMVSMAVFPILIGLGIDYAIEFQNRYTELLEEATHENV